MHATQVYDDMVADKDDKLDARKKDFDPSSGRERKDSRYIAQLKKSAEIRKVGVALDFIFHPCIHLRM